MKIGFIYYNFYPVTGGPSVHGYHLAKELSNLGYKLFKLNGAPDPHTTKLNPVTGLFQILKNCDLIYVRMDYFLKIRNLITLIAITAGKKVLVELNSPSDELHLFGKNKRYIQKADRWMKSVLKRVDGVIVVSQPVKEYCEKKLELQNVHVIENGGEVFQPDPETITIGLRDQIMRIKNKFSSIAVWSGSVNRMQDLSLLEEVAKAKSSELALFVLTKEEGAEPPVFESENIFLFSNLTRQEVAYIIASSDIGLAFYDDYSWSRFGYYNSSLKVFEYLNNGLLTITNKPGSAIQALYPNFKVARNVQEILTFTENVKQNSPAGQNIRTWRHVAEETAQIIGEITHKNS
jgi:hypothetical protein